MSQRYLNPHPQPYNGYNSQGNHDDAPTPVNPAYYVFNEKLMVFKDTINLLAKFSDTLMIDFGAGTLYIEAVAVTKSAHADATFEGNAIADWGYGDLEPIADKRIQLSTKQIVCALKNITKHDTLQFFICGMSCDKVSIEYTNVKNILRSYLLQARDVTLTYAKSAFSPASYSNRIICKTKFFDIIFSQLCDQDEMCLNFYGDHSVITKYVPEADKEHSSTLYSMQPKDNYDTYEITVPMSMILSVRELKVSLKLIAVHSFMAHIYFDIGGKPLMITFDDEEKDEKCTVLLSVADVREITDEEEEEPEAAASQSGIITNSQDRTLQSHNNYVPPEDDDQSEQRQQEEQEEEVASDEPPRKQRRKSKPFSFEDDEEDENNEPQQQQQNGSNNSAGTLICGNNGYVAPINIFGNVSQNQNGYDDGNNFQDNGNLSFNNGNYQEQDFDDIHPAAATSPSDPSQRERNSTSPYCVALRLLGIEDQISDPESPDVVQTYDLPATDPNEEYVQSQFPNRR